MKPALAYMDHGVAVALGLAARDLCDQDFVIGGGKLAEHATGEIGQRLRQNRSAVRQRVDFQPASADNRARFRQGSGLLPTRQGQTTSVRVDREVDDG